MKAAARIAGLIALVALIASCPLVERNLPAEEAKGETETGAATPDSDSGTLTIDFSSIFASARTLVPAGMSISRCDITGTLEGGGDSFAGSVGPGESFSRGGLAVGLWTIEIDAFNAGGTLVGHGETTARITAGSTTTARITIHPVPGNGTLSLTLRWGKSTFQSSSVRAVLSPAITADGTLRFRVRVEGDYRVGTYTSDAVPAGYYVLTLQLIGDGAVVWGTMEAVRIAAGLITEKTWTYAPP